jgi:[CysO sulfur-carrier protein]-S-L-cysteine hydrolase
MRIARELYDEMVSHARTEAPNECCGVVEARDGEAVKLHRATNIHASPLKFEIGPEELLAINEAIDDAGDDIGAIYHSHTRTAPKPSETDITFARGHPGVLWIIVGLRGDAPEVRTWLIADGHVSEAELVVG